MQQSNFDRFSRGWWDKKGDMKVLHSMHQTRMLFIKERINNRFKNFNSYYSILQKKKILDLGCGGGLLSESLAKDGANIMAIDNSEELIKIAKERAYEKKYNINYEKSTIEKLANKNEKFDIIISLEVIEHVKDYKIFLQNIFKCLKPEGLIIISTINRSFFSYISTILIAEKILKIVPDNIHDWNLYLKPTEIYEFSKKFKIKMDKLTGLLPFPGINGLEWIRTKNTSANYITSLTN